MKADSLADLVRMPARLRLVPLPKDWRPADTAVPTSKVPRRLPSAAAPSLA